MFRSHTFASSGEAYNVSQTDNAIGDGDILLVPSELRAAVVVGAWPVYVGGDTDPGPGDAFHALADGTTWVTLDDGKYHNAAVAAIALMTVERVRRAGLGATAMPGGLIAIARSHGWAGDASDSAG